MKSIAIILPLLVYLAGAQAQDVTEPPPEGEAVVNPQPDMSNYVATVSGLSESDVARLAELNEYRYRLNMGNQIIGMEWRGQETLKAAVLASIEVEISAIMSRMNYTTLIGQLPEISPEPTPEQPAPTE